MTTHSPVVAGSHVTATPFDTYQLHSAFQPIYSLSHRKAIGFEALVRPQFGPDNPVSPAALFDWAARHDRMRALDEACQRLHIRNFAALAPSDRWLFLNIGAQSITDRSFEDGSLANALATAKLPPQQLVIEILEGVIGDEGLLADAVAYFRSLGVLIALDDFGAGHSNFSRIWRLAPDIIKIDRQLLVEAERQRSKRLQRMLTNLVSLMHEAGSLVLAEGIETREQGLIALDSDIDFVQGFYFARPTTGALAGDDPEAAQRLEALNGAFAESACERHRLDRQRLAPYLDIFCAVVDAIEHGKPMNETVASLLRLAQVARFYVLDQYGAEITHYLGPARATGGPPASPIADASGGVWFRRNYFRNAIREPRRVQVSSPYLCSTGKALCTTFSRATETLPRRVYCCDIYA